MHGLVCPGETHETAGACVVGSSCVMPHDQAGDRRSWRIEYKTTRASIGRILKRCPNRTIVPGPSKTHRARFTHPRKGLDAWNCDEVHTMPAPCGHSADMRCGALWCRRSENILNIAGAPRRSRFHLHVISTPGKPADAGARLSSGGAGGVPRLRRCTGTGRNLGPGRTMALPGIHPCGPCSATP